MQGFLLLEDTVFGGRSWMSFHSKKEQESWIPPGARALTRVPVPQWLFFLCGVGKSLFRTGGREKLDASFSPLLLRLQGTWATNGGSRWSSQALLDDQKGRGSYFMSGFAHSRVPTSVPWLQKGHGLYGFPITCHLCALPWRWRPIICAGCRFHLCTAEGEKGPFQVLDVCAGALLSSYRISLTVAGRLKG